MATVASRAQIGVLCVLAAPGAARAASEDKAPVVEPVEILNNQYLQRDTLLFYVQTKPGDPYDEAKLRADFRQL